MNKDQKKIAEIRKIGGKNLNTISKFVLSPFQAQVIVEITNVTSSAIEEELSMTAKVLNEEARKISQKISNPVQSGVMEFAKQVEILLDHERAIEPLEAQFNNTIKRIPQNVFLTFFYTIKYLVDARRLFRRYIKARFGVKRIDKAKIDYFPNHYDRILYNSSVENFVEIDMQLFMWLYAIKETCDTYELYPSFKMFLSAIFVCMSRALSDFRLFLLHTEMTMRQNEGLSIETETAAFTAWAKSKISLSGHNLRLKKTVEKHGRSVVEGDIPSSVLFALAEKAPDEPYSSSKTRERSVISRTASNLEDKSLQHTEVNIDQAPEEIDFARFAAHEEAKIDLSRIIDLGEITDRAKTILFMKDIEEMSFEKIAEELGVRKSTVSNTYYRAMEKLNLTLSEKK